ncbi:MAG: hypothetical protein ACI8PQ_002909, partial [Planctomycetota bacterium]
MQFTPSHPRRGLIPAISTLVAGTVLAGTALAAALPSGPAVDSGQEAPKPTFDESADSPTLLKTQAHHAGEKHKRVLIIWGAEETADLGLFKALRRGKLAEWPIYYDFDILPIAVGAGAVSGNAMAEALGAKIGSLPALSLLDADMQVLSHRGTADWWMNDEWNKEAIAGYLLPLVLDPQDA